MASGGEREFPVLQRAGEREHRREHSHGRERDGERRGGRRGSGTGRARKRRSVPRQFEREEFPVRDPKAFGRGGNNLESNLPNSLGALQLESRTGRGGKTTRGLQEKRIDSGRRDGGGRRGRDEVKTPLDKLRWCEEKVCEEIQRWKEGCANYKEVEELVGMAWGQYVRMLLEGGMEGAVREGLGLRVWRNIHYPVIEQLRKFGEH